jgi:hypothetical protein
MFRNLDATIFVERATEFEWRDGLFHVTNYCGNSRIQWVYSPHVFLASLLGAEQAMLAYQAEATNAASNVHELYPVKALSA